MSNPIRPIEPAADAEEIRKQRHEFILRYYDMAVKDLERHLKIGWETIATVAGAVATLSLGYRDYLPIPLSISTAFIVSFWGILNIIDANYWALRAIAFLANVEAIYFYKDDQTIFNPYAGEHPPYKLLNSLKYQVLAAFFILFVGVVFFIERITRTANSYADFLMRVKLSGYPTLLYWLLPIIIFIILLNWVLSVWKKRIDDYLEFVEQAPGPGMLINRARHRDVNLTGNYKEEDIEKAESIQQRVCKDLKKKQGKWEPIREVVFVLSVATIVLLLLFVALKSRIFI